MRGLQHLDCRATSWSLVLNADVAECVNFRCFVFTNDGDGIVLDYDETAPRPLESAQFTRLAFVDAPELYVVQYLHRESQTLNRFVGHYCMLGLRHLIDSFTSGTGKLHTEIPRTSFQGLQEPYGRPHFPVLFLVA